jgi:hypothetical protein
MTCKANVQQIDEEEEEEGRSSGYIGRNSSQRQQARWRPLEHNSMRQCIGIFFLSTSAQLALGRREQQIAQHLLLWRSVD